MAKYWTILQNKMILDLNTTVDALQEDNKYQLSLKEMTYKEKINELNEKYLLQISSLNTEREVSFKRPKILFLFHNTNGLLKE